MTAVAQYRKAVGAFLALLSTWGISAIGGGIDGEEWFGLLGVIGGALLVERLTNAPQPLDPDDPEPLP